MSLLIGSLWFVAALMAVFTAWILTRGSGMKTLNDASVVLLLLSMMGFMFLSVVIYLYFPGYTIFWVLVAFNMVTMSIFLIPVLISMFFGDRKIDDLWGGSVEPKTVMVGFAIAFVLIGEIFMGWSFSFLSGATRAEIGWSAVYSAFVRAASSSWFVFTMSAEMCLTFAALRRRFEGGVKWIVGAQPIMMFFSPPAIPERTWVDVSFIANTVVMLAVTLYALHYLRNNQGLRRSTFGYVACLVASYGAMMTGLALWFLDGDASLFALSILFQMVIYLYIILEDKHLGAREMRSQGGFVETR